MPQYHFQWQDGSREEVITAPSKVAATRQYYKKTAPAAMTQQAFLEFVECMPIKVAKSALIRCAICEQTFGRKEFVGHVRTDHK